MTMHAVQGIILFTHFTSSRGTRTRLQQAYLQLLL